MDFSNTFVAKYTVAYLKEVTMQIKIITSTLNQTENCTIYSSKF